jgi:hypothetical protein
MHSSAELKYITTMGMLKDLKLQVAIKLQKKEH